MSRATRLKLINSLEKQRGSRLLCYVTSTRQNLDVEMHPEHVRTIYDHVESMRGSKIDLFIHSNGGDATVPWRLTNLIRESATEFSVLIPYKAFSAATLTALGADYIVMHRMGNLGPTDPTVANQYNPVDHNNRRIGINVEDVNGYIQLGACQ